jgi:single-strand DNA-binding protein
MNKVILIGNLTRDPELASTPSGTSVCHFSIAVSRDYANADGNRETDFFNVNVWRERGENCHKYLKKGNKVAVVGSLQNRSYEDKDGVKRTITEIVANEVEFLTPKQANEDAGVSSVRRERVEPTPIDDNQLPF